ncbi:MAG: DUF721 domain-containing protein [Candidatus Syntrophosphaera sp.]
MDAKAFTAVSQLQKQVILKIGGEKFQPFIELYQAWKQVVGDLLASRSHPFRYHNSVLYIAVENNSWMQELVLRKTDIIRQCKARVADLKDIIFMIRS